MMRQDKMGLCWNYIYVHIMQAHSIQLTIFGREHSRWFWEVGGSDEKRRRRRRMTEPGAWN
jgi:hypothetical protein